MDFGIEGNNPLRVLILGFLLILLVQGCRSVRETKREYIIGYHVQLVQTSDRAEAEAFREKAMLEFDEDVYFLFEAPFYKVRVGDFLDIGQAEILQQLAVKKGFENAWIVRGKVDLNKVPSEY